MDRFCSFNSFNTDEFKFTLYSFQNYSEIHSKVVNSSLLSVDFHSKTN